MRSQSPGPQVLTNENDTKKVNINSLKKNEVNDLDNTVRSEIEIKDVIKQSNSTNMTNTNNIKQILSTLKKEIGKRTGEGDLPSVKMWKTSLAFIDTLDINKAYKNVIESGKTYFNYFNR